MTIVSNITEPPLTWYQMQRYVHGHSFERRELFYVLSLRRVGTPKLASTVLLKTMNGCLLRCCTAHLQHRLLLMADNSAPNLFHYKISNHTASP